MVVQDVIAVVMVQAEAADRGWLAGWMDTFGWYFGIETTSISVGALHAGGSEKFYVLAFVGAANLLGTKLGQVTGRRIMGTAHKETVTSLAAKVADLQHEVATLRAAVAAG